MEWPSTEIVVLASSILACSSVCLVVKTSNLKLGLSPDQLYLELTAVECKVEEHLQLA